MMYFFENWTNKSVVRKDSDMFAYFCCHFDSLLKCSPYRDSVPAILVPILVTESSLPMSVGSKHV